MGSLFSGPPDMPKPKPPPQPKTDDMSTQNAETAEKLRRMRALGKQKSILAGDIATSPNLITAKLGGGF